MRTRAGGRLAVLLAVLLGAVFGFHRIVDPDLFQHIAVGRTILAHPGEIGRSSFHDLYRDRVYVEDKPLGSVLAALADRVGGEDGLAAYQLLLSSLVATAWFLLLRAAGAGPWAALAAVAVALACAAYRLEPRPDTWSHALLALTATLILRAEFSRLVWALPLVFVLWANLHGYWVTGIVVLLAAAVAAALGSAPGPIGQGRPAALKLLALAGLCVVACAVHPQGWRAVAWPIEQLRVLRAHAEMRQAIVEFLPAATLAQGGRAWHALVAAAFPLLGFLAAAGRQRWPARTRALVGLALGVVWLLVAPPGFRPWPYRLTSAVTLTAALELPSALRDRRWFPVLAWLAACAMAWPMVRNLTLLAPVSLWLLAPSWRLPARLAPTLAGVLVLVVAWARFTDRLPPGTARAPGWSGWGIARDVIPLGAANYLASDPPSQRILNDFQAGGVLLARLPGTRVFIAGNTSLYPPEHLALYRDEVLTGKIAANALPARFGVDTVVLGHASLETPRFVASLARSRSWRLTFLDEAGAVFRWEGDGIDVARTARDIADRLSSRSPLPPALWPARRIFPALNLGVFLRAYGRPDLALSLAERLWEEGPRIELATFRAAAAEEAGVLGTQVPFLEEASRALGRSAALESRLARALFFRAVDAMAGGDLESAARDLQRATELRRDEPGPWLALARISAVRGDRAHALELLVQARRVAQAGVVERAIQGDPVLRELK